MQLLDGKLVSENWRRQTSLKVAKLKKAGIEPALAAIIVGNDPASEVYVGMKAKRCESVGIRSEIHTLPENTTQDKLNALIDRLNEDSTIHGILLQHPIPKHLNENEALMRIKPEKDADGITPYSLGTLTAGIPGLRPATPLGIIYLLDYYKIKLEGLNAVVVGRSVILGKPVALMLLEKNATVTICHTKTRNLSDICRNADVLVSAVGKPEFIGGDWIKEGAIVVDAGYSRIEGRKGDVGDVCFDSAKLKADWITPVPGGVGPMTIAALLSNTVASAETQNHFRQANNE